MLVVSFKKTVKRVLRPFEALYKVTKRHTILYPTDLKSQTQYRVFKSLGLVPFHCK